MNFFKRIVAALAFSGLAIGAASAADLPSRYTTPAVPVFTEVPFSWTGFYAGINGGYGFNGKTNYTHQNNNNFGGIGGTYSNDTKGFTGGVQAGYNVQMGVFVFGLEGSANYADVKGNYNFSQYYDNTTTKISQIYTITPRIGVAFDRLMVYGKGGWALAKVESGQSYAPPRLTATTWSNSVYQNGWTVGGGAEYALTNHWTVGLEYNYIRLSNKAHSSADSYGKLTNISASPNLHEALARLNYKF